MLIPTKHEDLNTNIIVVGADLLQLLKNKSYSIEDLFKATKNLKSINLEHFYHTLLFLWLAELIVLEESHVKIIKNTPDDRSI